MLKAKTSQEAIDYFSKAKQYGGGEIICVGFGGLEKVCQSFNEINAFYSIPPRKKGDRYYIIDDTKSSYSYKERLKVDYDAMWDNEVKSWYTLDEKKSMDAEIMIRQKGAAISSNKTHIETNKDRMKRNRGGK